VFLGKLVNIPRNLFLIQDTGINLSPHLKENLASAKPQRRRSP